MLGVRGNLFFFRFVGEWAWFVFGVLIIVLYLGKSFRKEWGRCK